MSAMFELFGRVMRAEGPYRCDMRSVNANELYTLLCELELSDERANRVTKWLRDYYGVLGLIRLPHVRAFYLEMPWEHRYLLDTMLMGFTNLIKHTYGPISPTTSRSVLSELPGFIEGLLKSEDAW